MKLKKMPWIGILYLILPFFEPKASAWIKRQTVMKNCKQNLILHVISSKM